MFIEHSDKIIKHKFNIKINFALFCDSLLKNVYFCYDFFFRSYVVSKTHVHVICNVMHLTLKGYIWEIEDCRESVLLPLKPHKPQIESQAIMFLLTFGEKYIIKQYNEPKAEDCKKWLLVLTLKHQLTI